VVFELPHPRADGRHAPAAGSAGAHREADVADSAPTFSHAALFTGCSRRTRRGGRRSFRRAPRLTRTAPAAVGSPRESASAVGDAAAPGVRHRRLCVSALRGRRRLVGCTPGASACGPCSSGWGSSARRPRAEPARSPPATGHVTERGTRSQHSLGLTIRAARRRLPPGFVLARAVPGVFSPRAEFSPARALLSAVEGHRPRSPSRRRLTWAAGGAIVARAAGGQGERVDDGERAFEFLASAAACQTCGVERCAVFTRPPTWLRIDDRRGGRYLAAPEFHHGVTSPCVSRLDYPARFGLDRSGLGEPRLLTSQAVQDSSLDVNITLPAPLNVATASRKAVSG